MLKFFIALMTGVWIANPAMADRLPVGEIQPTPEMLAKARRVIPPQGADDRIIYHFRRAGETVLVCGYHWGGNGRFCTRTPLSLVRKIDERAEDACRQGETGIPHAMTGEAIVLNYDCVRGHLKRQPYAYAFDLDGYMMEEWRPLP
jgi:hypothetical protein